MPNFRLDKFILIDLELTCWKEHPPLGERNEIIEIGIAEVQTGKHPKIVKSKSYLVKPQFSTVSQYCTDLTHITPRMLAKQGRPLDEVCNSIRKEFGGSGKTWGAWGMDNIDLQKDCAAMGIKSPISESWIDLGQLWGLLSGAQKGVGLVDAMKYWGLQFEGTQHRAGVDADNLARLFIEMSSFVQKPKITLSQIENQEKESSQDLTCKPSF